MFGFVVFVGKMFDYNFICEKGYGLVEFLFIFVRKVVVVLDEVWRN